MSNFNELKNKVSKLFDGAEVFSKQAGYETISKNILKTKNEFLSKELMVVVCGEIKRGKSSLLTAFLEEKDIFPIDINTCTNVVTIVRYGEVEKIEAILEKQTKSESTYEHVLMSLPWWELGRRRLQLPGFLSQRRRSRRSPLQSWFSVGLSPLV